jgi:restriction system protein
MRSKVPERGVAHRFKGALYELQELVAGILRAMGYKTRVSPPGADRGVDIFASPDGLGLEEPRIFVEVKHRLKSTMGSTDLRSFIGGRKPADRCLYVSTGGFTKEARYEADRAAVPLTLVDLPALRELLLVHYDGVDAEARQLVPLTRVYWPIKEDE